MEYPQLGHGDLRVSALGLGTMAFGEQASEQEARARLGHNLAADALQLPTEVPAALEQVQLRHPDPCG